MKASLVLLSATLALANCYTPKTTQFVCPCPRIYMPVCGTDGWTYSNKCELQCRNKQTNTNIAVAYNGQCKSAAIKTTFVGYCNENWEPVCGTDGKTYANPCHLVHAQKVTNGDLHIAYRGECEADKEAEEKICGCEETWSPVCGSDDHTYTNLCQLECTRKRTNADLKIVRAMPCERQELVMRPVCACNRMYKPVCGSDGKTYGNRCMFECQRSNNQNLMVAHDGEC